jgi:hypothetical protein
VPWLSSCGALVARVAALAWRAFDVLLLDGCTAWLPRWLAQLGSGSPVAQHRTRLHAPAAPRAEAGVPGSAAANAGPAAEEATVRDAAVPISAGRRRAARGTGDGRRCRAEAGVARATRPPDWDLAYFGNLNTPNNEAVARLVTECALLPGA